MKFTIIIDTTKIRKFFVSKWFIILLSFIMLSSTVFALNVAITTFSSGTPALASEINTNFNNLMSVFNTSTGYIPYDDGTKLSNSRIYNIGESIGIGTTNPLGQFNIAKHTNGNVGEFLIGDNPTDAEENRSAVAIDLHTDGNAYFDAKVYAGGKLYYRVGQGTEPSYQREWMRVTATTGNVTFGNSVFIGNNIGIGTVTPTSKLQVVGLPEYSDNATALANGLTAGAFYRTGDLLKVVH